MAEKPKSENKKEPASKQEDKVLIIPLRHQSRKSAKNMRKNRAVREIRLFLARHMRTEPSKVSISQQLNEHLWKGGLHNTPAKIKVRVSTDEDGKVSVRLLDEKEKPKLHKKKPGLMNRLARRKETPKEEKPAARKEEKPAAKPAVPKPEEKKPEPKKELPKEAPPEEEVLEE